MRFRTVFTNTVDFSGWWIKSKGGLVAEIIHAGMNRDGELLYNLKAESNYQIGNGVWTMEDIVSSVLMIRPKRKHLDGKQTEISFRHEEAPHRPRD